MTAPAAIVLAAGEGRRMGGPKALLVVDGKPLICGHVERLREIGCWPIIVVVRAAVIEVVSALLGKTSGARIISTDSSSMAASLTVGLGYVSPELSEVVVVSPVDALPARRSTLRALLAAVMTDDVRVATPRYGGRGGHPIVARESLLRVFRHGYSGTLRDLVRSADAQRRRIDVDDAGCIGLDTPADLAALRPGLVPSFATSGTGSRDRTRSRSASPPS